MSKHLLSYDYLLGKRKEGEPGLEDKIVQTNPVLEAVIRLESDKNLTFV